MKISHIALACALAVGGSAAFAQNETVNQPNQNGSVSATELGQKAKRGAKRVGNATKNAYNKVKGKVQAGQQRDAANGGVSNSGMQSDQTNSMGNSASRQQRM